MNELSINLRCVLLIGGLEIWLEEERAQNLEKLMETVKYARLENSIIAVSQIAGIFSPEHMNEFKRLKQGQWHCMKGNQWHDKGEKCKCEDFRILRLLKMAKEAQEKCGLCKDGIVIIIDENNISHAITCECSKEIVTSIENIRKENHDE